MTPKHGEPYQRQGCCLKRQIGDLSRHRRAVSRFPLADLVWPQKWERTPHACRCAGARGEMRQAENLELARQCDAVKRTRREVTQVARNIERLPALPEEQESPGFEIGSLDEEETALPENSPDFFKHGAGIRHVLQGVQKQGGVKKLIRETSSFKSAAEYCCPGLPRAG